MKNKIIAFLFLCALFSMKSFGQDSNNVWSFGIGMNAIDYFPSHAPNTGNEDGFLNEIFNSEDHWNVSGPQFLVNRYLVNNLSIDGLLSFNSIKKYGDVATENTPYIGIDLNLRYSFLDPSKDFNIFALLGGGYTFAFYSGGTVNAGLGMSYWFSDTIGLQAQSMYKYNSSQFKLAPHFYYGLTLAFRIQSRKKFIWRDGI